LSIDGSVTGTNVPGSAKAVVIWQVTSGADYAYKFGEGTSSGAQLTLAFSTDPPTEAINAYGVGVGFVALVAAGTQVPDGVFDAGQLTALGVSFRYAVIWRDQCVLAQLQWPQAFPAGYACGRCVPATSGFDSFEPVDCSEVQIETDLASGAGCNWT
jgi:hypothetical protein